MEQNWNSTYFHYELSDEIPMDEDFFFEYCRSSRLSIKNYNLLEWNETLMRELYEQGCNCNAIVTANNISNVVCSGHILQHTWWVQCIYILLFSSIVLLSVGGNLTVVWIVIWHKRMRASVTNYFLLNLAIADASISLFNVCFSFTYNLYYDWYFGDTYCTFNNFMGVTPTSASVFTLMAMSLDRYVAIIYPLRRRPLSRTSTIVVIILIWMGASLCALPMLLYSRTLQFFFMDGRKDTVCLADNYPDGDARTSVHFKIYNYFLLSVNYLIPLIVLTLAYIRVGFELWGGQSIGEHRQAESVRTKRKVVKMMIAVVSIFMVAWFPYHAYFTMFMDKFAEMNLEYALHIYLNMYFLAMSATCVNPFLYCWMNRRFRIGFRYAFRWLPCVQITKEQYLESDLHAHCDRLNHSSAATFRRRSSHAARFNHNGDAASPSHIERGRIFSEGVVLTRFDQTDDTSQRIALLPARRLAASFGSVPENL